MPSDALSPSHARVELSVLEALLDAEGAFAPEGATGAVLRGWSALGTTLAPAPGAEAPSNLAKGALPAELRAHLEGCLGAPEAAAIAADLAVIAADPYHRLDRKTLERHRDGLRYCLRESRGEAAIRGRKRLARGVVLGMVVLAGCAWAVDRWIHPPRWRAAYFSGTALLGDPHLHTAGAVDFKWMGRRPRIDLGPDNFSARWDSCLELDTARIVDFTLGSDDGSRLFIDGEPIIDLWSEHGFQERTAEQDMKPGRHALRVDYYQAVGDAEVHLQAISPKESAWTPIFRLPAEPFNPASPCR
jgi:hypothetical protein